MNALLCVGLQYPVMNKPSKDDVQKFSDEDLAALGRSIAGREQLKQQLLDRARGGNLILERLLVPLVLLVIVITVTLMGPMEPLLARHVLLAAGIVLIAVGIQNHMLFRRQDALMDLLEPLLREDRK
ncbi:MAG: hypothetical protein ACPGVU_05930 [Limisphaerales bacterium]